MYPPLKRPLDSINSLVITTYVRILRAVSIERVPVRADFI